MQRASKHASGEWEIQTIALIVTCYMAWLVLLLSHELVPWWIEWPLGALILTFYGSLQHEVIHYHPTPYRWLNEALVFPNLMLWLPFKIYRDSHQRHHRNEFLTDPFEDPESYFFDHSQWQALPRGIQRIYELMHTLAGRLLLGPLQANYRLYTNTLKAFFRGDFSALPAWGLHFIAVSMVLFAVVFSGLPLWEYLIWVYGGLSITLLRSYAEHQPVKAIEGRSVVVKAHPFWGFLFLNNNLHYVHHAYPALAWYELPRRMRMMEQQGELPEQLYVFNGYGEQFRRYLYRAKEHPLRVI